MSTPNSVFPPPAREPGRTAAASSFEDTLDETIDQSFPASDPPSTNPAPTHGSETSETAEAAFGSTSDEGRHLHLRHEGLLWAAAGALGAAASMRLLGGRRSSLVWQLAPAALLAGAAIAFARRYASRDETAGC